jgi:hypothetical protein
MANRRRLAKVRVSNSRSDRIGCSPHQSTTDGAGPRRIGSVRSSGIELRSAVRCRPGQVFQLGASGRTAGGLAGARSGRPDGIVVVAEDVVHHVSPDHPGPKEVVDDDPLVVPPHHPAGPPRTGRRGPLGREAKHPGSRGEGVGCTPSPKAEPLAQDEVHAFGGRGQVVPDPSCGPTSSMATTVRLVVGIRSEIHHPQTCFPSRRASHTAREHPCRPRVPPSPRSSVLCGNAGAGSRATGRRAGG